MMVPRSFHCAPPLSLDSHNEKSSARLKRNSVSPAMEKRSTARPAAPARTTTEPARLSSPPISVLAPARTHLATASVRIVQRGSTVNERRCKTAAHDPSALPPAVAALLAITQIPRRKSDQPRKQSICPRRISIDELMNEWKNDDIFESSSSSNAALGVLLEDDCDEEGKFSTKQDYSSEVDDFSPKRCNSDESVPSLDADDQSILSIEGALTPESMRSNKSSSPLRKEKPRSVPSPEDCVLDHPLVPVPFEEESKDDDNDFILSLATAKRSPRPKPKSSLRSNLTLSLQNLRTAALKSLSSFTLGTDSSKPLSTQASRTRTVSAFPDEALWSHPFLFPRLSSEIRPDIDGLPTEAQRRYLNPLPLTFEEQEGPYQMALHGPYLAEQVEPAPTIQMQSYGRRRKLGSKRGAFSPPSEASRALLGAAGIRHRELRENSDFLRVVVMEMNMKRAGKLQAQATHSAKLWLPPRQATPVSQMCGKVPKRWVGESAD